MKRLKILLLLVLAISCSKRKVECYPEKNVSVSAGSDDHQGEPATGKQAKHGPSKAVQHFKGADQGGIDLRKYDSWYDNITLEYLANTLRATQCYLLKVVLKALLLGPWHR